MMIMKKTKVNRINFVKDKKGLTILEFIIVTVWVFIIVAIFIEIGYALKSEAVIMGAARRAVRQVNVTGAFNNDIRDEIIDKLGQHNIEVTKVGFEIQNTFFYGIPLEGEFKIPIGFRQNYQISIWGNHKLKAVTFSNTYPLQIPLVFALNGRGELWTTDSLREYYDEPRGEEWLIERR